MAPPNFPKVPLKSWTTLQAKASATPSTRFTAPTVSALLGLGSAESATSNVLRPMQRLGIFHEDGSLTERGAKWRTDSGYADACQEIIDEVYPSDLAALTDASGKPDRAALQRWFDQQGIGSSNAKQMAATYNMIAVKELPEVKAEGGAKPSTPSSRASTSRDGATKRTKPTESVAPAPAPLSATPPTNGGGPSVHLDIQIHIPADATAEQIDKIFASMAKHLYHQ